MRACPHFAAKKSAHGAFAGRDAAPWACNGSARACCRELQDCNASLLPYIAALWAYLVAPRANNARLLTCNVPRYPCNVPLQESGSALPGYYELARVFIAALQSCLETMSPFFLALQANARSMQASAGTMQANKALARNPFFPTEDNPTMEVN